MSTLFTAGLLMAPPAAASPVPAEAPPADQPGATSADPSAAQPPAGQPPTSEAPPDASALDPAERPDESGAAAPASPEPAPGSLPPVVGPGDQTVGGPPVAPVTPPPATGPGPAQLEPGPQATVSREQTQKSYPEIPIRWRAELGLGGGTTTFLDPASKAVSSSSRYNRLDVTARGDMRLGDGRIFLGGVGGYRGFITDAGDIYNVADLELELREPYFALRLAVMAIEGVDVFVEAGGGPSLIRTEFKTDDRHFDDTVSGYAMGHAGVMLYLPKKWLIRRGSSRVTVGLELGVGGAYRPDLTLNPARDTPDDPIDTGNLNLGSVNLSGVTWRAGVFVRFM